MLIIIPARSGSKRLVNKNIKLLNEKPLMDYTIEAAINSEIAPLEMIYLNTDSEEYMKRAYKFGINTYLRNKKFATDSAKTNDLILDMISRLNYEGDFILLQTTSPLRDENDIIEAYELYKKSNIQVLVSCSSISDRKYASKLTQEPNLLNSKHLQPNGAIYISNTRYFNTYKSFYSKLTNVYIMSNDKSIDIDTQSEFEEASKLLKTLERKL